MSKLQKNWLEWTVFACGLVLVVATLGYLAYEGATMGNDPPSIEVRLGTPEQRTHNFIVPVTVTNHGDETAEGITVEVTLENNGSGEGGSSEPVRGELTIAFLPRRATREGWVTFQQDPRSGRLTARVLGYEKP
ncbi:MAG TPA: hypothetical protein VGO96_16745 [Pyrinomonadaceae bacterium]|jgi:uncharacterized protein (TIGR02588 family)|nr:hypothetical protein [Pyrinomonadaceae bacterium]